MTAKEIHEDSCGKSEDDETPQRSLRGGSARARGKRSVFPKRGRNTNSLRPSLYILCLENLAFAIAHRQGE